MPLSSLRSCPPNQGGGGGGGKPSKVTTQDKIHKTRGRKPRHQHNNNCHLPCGPHFVPSGRTRFAIRSLNQPPHATPQQATAGKWNQHRNRSHFGTVIRRAGTNTWVGCAWYLPVNGIQSMYASFTSTIRNWDVSSANTTCDTTCSHGRATSPLPLRGGGGGSGTSTQCHRRKQARERGSATAAVGTHLANTSDPASNSQQDETG